MPQAKILNIHCNKTYNEGKDFITIKLVKDLHDTSESYTFTAEDIEANTIREVNDGLQYAGQTVKLILSLTDPNLIIGEKALNPIHWNKGERKVRFTNSNADYEISFEITN